MKKPRKKNKKDPPFYNAYHNATTPFFGDSKRCVFYEQILVVNLSISDKVVLTIVQNKGYENASTVEELAERVNRGTFKAIHVGPKKIKFVIQIVDKFKAEEWPKVTVPLPDHSSGYL